MNVETPQAGRGTRIPRLAPSTGRPVEPTATSILKRDVDARRTLLTRESRILPSQCQLLATGGPALCRYSLLITGRCTARNASVSRPRCSGLMWRVPPIVSASCIRQNLLFGSGYVVAVTNSAAERRRMAKPQWAFLQQTAFVFSVTALGINSIGRSKEPNIKDLPVPQKWKTKDSIIGW